MIPSENVHDASGPLAGLTVDETATAPELWPDTVMSDCKLAKMWLLREMEGGSQR